MHPLRQFKDLEDLFSNVDRPTILSWVNGYADMKEAQRQQGKRYRVKQQEFTKVAKRILDPDEVKRIMRLAELRAAEEVEDE